MEREVFDRILQAGQLTWEELHPTEFVHPNLQDILKDLPDVQVRNDGNTVKEQNTDEHNK